MRKYLKKKENKLISFFTKKIVTFALCVKKWILITTKFRSVLASTLFALLIFGVCMRTTGDSEIGIVEKDMTLAMAPLAATNVKKETISIPSGVVKANPFLPYRDLGGNSVSDVPNFEIIEPPEVLASDSEAARVMDTSVSGILYDKFNPSAILNIEGNDYLVKKGDVVNNYKIVNIAQDSVTVSLGKNTYKAGIGEILTEGSMNHSNIPNLDKKFGGDKQ